MNEEKEKKITQIIDIVSNQIKIPNELISEKSSPSDFPTWDSLNNVQIFIKLSESFNTNLSIEKYFECKNIEDISNNI